MCELSHVYIDQHGARLHLSDAMVQIGDFEPRKIEENDILQIGRSLSPILV